MIGSAASSDHSAHDIHCGKVSIGPVQANFCWRSAFHRPQ